MSAPLERTVVFACGTQSLLGILHVPATDLRDVGVVVVVGGPQYRIGSHRQFVLLARGLASRGYAVLRFDYRGMGDSDGRMRGFEHIEEDIAAGIGCLLDNVRSLRGVVLWALCDAASACLMYHKDDARVRGLILVNPFVHSVRGEARAYLRYYYLKRLLQGSFWRKVLSGGFNPWRALRALLVTAGRARGAGPGETQAARSSYIERMLAGLVRCRAPILIMLSERDLTARAFADLAASHDRWRAELAKSARTVESLSGADHTFSSRAVLDRATGLSLAWLDHNGRPG